MPTSIATLLGIFALFSACALGDVSSKDPVNDEHQADAVDAHSSLVQLDQSRTVEVHAAPPSRRRRKTTKRKPPAASRRRRRSTDKDPVGIASRVTKLEKWLKQSNANIKKLKSKSLQLLLDSRKRDENMQKIQEELSKRIDGVEAHHAKEAKEHEERHEKEAKEHKDRHAKAAKAHKDDMAKMKSSVQGLHVHFSAIIRGLQKNLTNLRDEVEGHHQATTTAAPATGRPPTGRPPTGVPGPGLAQVVACKGVKGYNSRCLMWNKGNPFLSQRWDVGFCQYKHKSTTELFCDKYPVPAQVACDGKAATMACTVSGGTGTCKAGFRLSPEGKRGSYLLCENKDNGNDNDNDNDNDNNDNDNNNDNNDNDDNNNDDNDDNNNNDNNNNDNNN